MPTSRLTPLIYLLLSLFILSGCGSVYDDTKGWGVDLWEEVKKGSKQAATSTKEALDSVSENSDEKQNDENQAEIKDSIETTKLTPVTPKDGSPSKPSPLNDSEKMAQPPEVKSNGKYAIHLSSNKSKKSAEKEWSELKNAFPKETEGLILKLKPVTISGKGTFFRVLGAAFETKSKANSACERFKKKKQYCVSLKL